MKTVYVAHKLSYGREFECVFNTLDELKRAIVKNELGKYNRDTKEIEYQEYSEENYQKALKKGQYKPHKVELHESEYILFDEYDGSSSFYIEKKDKRILSEVEEI